MTVVSSDPDARYRGLSTLNEAPSGTDSTDLHFSEDDGDGSVDDMAPCSLRRACNGSGGYKARRRGQRQGEVRRGDGGNDHIQHVRHVHRTNPHGTATTLRPVTLAGVVVRVLRNTRGGRDEAGKPRLRRWAGRRREDFTMLGREKGSVGVVCGVQERRGRGRTSGTDIPEENDIQTRLHVSAMNEEKANGKIVLHL